MAARNPKIPAIDPRFACYRLRIGKSGIRGRGVYACEAIPPRRKVIEYTGEKITERESTRRRRRGHYQYIFRLSRRWSLDARLTGSGAEYVNHGCDPNLFSMRRSGHIILMSRRRIEPGEELSCDYYYSPDAIYEPCHCGSTKCRGSINLRRPRNRSKTSGEKLSG